MADVRYESIAMKEEGMPLLTVHSLLRTPGCTIHVQIYASWTHVRARAQNHVGLRRYEINALNLKISSW